MYSQSYRVSKYFLSLESVDEPHGNVADKKEGDGLTGGLTTLLFRKVNSTTRYISNEKQLQNNL